MEPKATLVPGRPGTLTLPREKPIIVTRDDGALQVYSPQAGPANCCGGQMLHTFVCRDGVTLCPTCDAKRSPR